MPVTQAEIREFVGICHRHDVSRKARFATLGKKIAKSIAEKMKLEAGTFDIRYNRAGPAVMGDLRLHSDTLYLTLEPGAAGGGFMYRTCKGRQDYTGGPNQWANHADLLDLDAFSQKMVKFLERHATVHA